MRRILAVATLGAALGAALFAFSACADPPQPKPGTDPSAATTTKGGGGSALADKTKTCADYQKVVTDFNTRMTPIIAGAASAQGDQTKAAALATEFQSVVKGYETEAAKIEANAGDAEVKSAISAEIAASRKVQTDLLATGGDPVKVQTVVATAPKPGDKVNPVCGK